MTSPIEKSLLDIDFASLTRRTFTPSPAAWEDQVLYFLLLDRFSDGNEKEGYRDHADRPVQGSSITTCGSAPAAAGRAAIFAPLRDTLLTNGDRYMRLADLESYQEAERRLLELYADPDGRARKAILNVAGSGKFSSDRTLAESAASIWNARPSPVSRCS